MIYDQFDIPYCEIDNFDSLTWYVSTYSCEEAKTGKACWHVMENRDGDWCDIEETDLPTVKDRHEAWMDYYQYCIDIGADPLNIFLIPKSRKINEAWKVWLSPTIAGVRLVKIRRGNKIYDCNNLPTYVEEFLNLNKKTLILRDFERHDGNLYFQSIFPTMKFYRFESISIINNIPIQENIIADRVKQAAKRAIAQEKKRWQKDVMQ